MEWTNKDRLQCAFIVLALIVVAVVWVGIYVETKECDAKGGKRLRGLLEGFKCYDLRALKVLP